MYAALKNKPILGEIDLLPFKMLVPWSIVVRRAVTTKTKPLDWRGRYVWRG